MTTLPSSQGDISAFNPLPFPDLVKTLAKHFASINVEAYLVGGVLRDSLLGSETKDIDIAVVGDAIYLGKELASSINGHFVELHPDFGISRVVVDTSNTQSYIDLNSIQGTINDDLARRDFTIDSFAIPLADAVTDNPWESLIDPNDGLSDLQSGTVREVSSSVFSDDPARLMRAVRLTTQLNFDIEHDTFEQIQKDAHLVASVAPERTREELMRLFSNSGAMGAIRLLDDLGILCLIIPELAEAKGVTQPKEHHWDVFNHLVETVGHVERLLENELEHEDWVQRTLPRFDGLEEYFSEDVGDGYTRLAMLKLCGLLHDISKPATRTVEESGRIRFIGHDKEGADVSREILKRLRFSRKGIELIGLMVHHHLRPSQMAPKGELPSGRAIYRYYKSASFAAIDTLYLNMADYLAARGPDLDEPEWEKHRKLIDHILTQGLEEKAPEALPKLLDGRDIMVVYSLSPGPEIGKLLDMVREAQANGEIHTKEQALGLVNASLNIGGGGA